MLTHHWFYHRKLVRLENMWTVPYYMQPLNITVVLLCKQSPGFSHGTATHGIVLYVGTWKTTYKHKDTKPLQLMSLIFDALYCKVVVTRPLVCLWFVNTPFLLGLCVYLLDTNLMDVVQLYTCICTSVSVCVCLYHLLCMLQVKVRHYDKITGISTFRYVYTYIHIFILKYFIFCLQGQLDI